MDEPAVARAGRRSTRRVFAAVALPLVAVFSFTAEWELPYHVDAVTVAITGWYVGTHGTVIASEHDDLASYHEHGYLGSFVTSPEGTVLKYPPGAALVVGLAYAVAPESPPEPVTIDRADPDAPPVRVEIPTLWPATLSAVLSTALAAGLLAVVFLDLLGDPRRSMVGGLAFGLATGAWSVASAMSWMHGPAMLAVALALLAASRQRWLACGLAFGFAVLTRPHLVAVAAAIGIASSVTRRSLRPAVLVGIGSGAGLAALLAYNQAIFHELSLSGGYSSKFGVGLHNESGPLWYLGNVLGGMVDPQHGLLVWAPFLLVLVPGVFIARREVPDWAIAAAVGSVVYLLVQYRANRFSGGDGHFGYRYPLEALTAAAPALAVGYDRWVRHHEVAQRLFVGGLAVGFASQLLASVT